MVRSRLRFAAGACVLAAGLLMGAGAVAVADPGSGGDDGTNAPVQGSPTAGSPVGNVTGTVRETVRGVTSTLGSGPQPGQQSTGPTSTLGSGRQPGQQSTGPTSTLGSGRQPGQQPSTGATSPTTEAGGTATEDQEDAGLVPADPNPVAAVPNVVGPVTDAVAPVTGVVAPVTDVIAPVTGVVAPVTDVVTSVMGCAGTADCRCGRPAHATAVRPFLLLVGHRRGGTGRGRIGRHPRPWASGSRGCVGRVASAAGSYLCGCLGRAGRRQRNQGCNPGCDFARSSVSAVRGGTASTRWRLSDGCGVVFPACLRRTPSNRFTVGAGRCRSARSRRACDPYRSRGAHRIRQADAGFASRTSSIARFARPAGRYALDVSSIKYLAAVSPGIQLSTRWRTPGSVTEATAWVRNLTKMSVPGRVTSRVGFEQSE